jgi:hypothetical protein
VLCRLTHVCQKVSQHSPRRVLVVLQLDRDGHERRRDDGGVEAGEHQAGADAEERRLALDDGLCVKEGKGSYIIVKITCRAAILFDRGCCLACDGASLLLMDPSLHPSSAISDREGLGYGSAMSLDQQLRSEEWCGVVDGASLCPRSIVGEAIWMELSRSFASGSSILLWAVY